MTAPSNDDFTELVDADIPRVDLVGKAANGTRFLIAKAAGDGLLQPLVAPDQVRELLAKADAQEGAPVTQPAPTDTVAKDAPPVAADDLIETAGGGSTAESLPGSPDWENLDGDTAMNAVATLGRVKAALAWLSDREAQEAVTGDDPRDGDNAWDLDDMACQLDWMIGRLAGFAVGEHMEAEMADELTAVGKAVADVTGPLAVLEGYGPVVKAGRTLSGANEAKIRTAVDSLTEVLNSLPQAPAADDVTKETAVAKMPPLVVEVQAKLVGANVETTIVKGTDQAAAMLAGLPALAAADVLGALVNGGRTVDVTKAAGDPQLAVFDADGKLIGTIDPAKLSPIATSPAAATADETPAADEGAVQPADPAAAPADPAADPATEAVIPGTNTVQAPPAADDTDSTVTKAVASALAEALTPVTKQLQELVADNEDLKERVEKMGAQPDNRRSPVLNGATGSPGAVTRDATADEPFAELRKAVDEAKTDGERATASASLAYAKVQARFER